MINSNFTKSSKKRVSVLGSLNPPPCYEEWEQFMLCKFSDGDVSEFVITSADLTLNSYVRKFCVAHDFIIRSVELDSSIQDEIARQKRNEKLIQETDLVVLFVPDKSGVDKRSDKSLATPGGTDALVVFNNLVFHTIPNSIGNIQPSANQMTPESVKKDELITVEEEVALVCRAQKGDKEALARLIYVNKRFVRSIARHYEDSGLTLDQLISEGNKGVEAACMKFEPTRGFKFISFAAWFIRQSIGNAINKSEKNNNNNQLIYGILQNLQS